MLHKGKRIYEDKRVFAGTSSWKEQFTEALTVSGGDEDEGEGTGEAAAPSTLDYLMHGLTILWKVLFAFVPPTGKYRAIPRLHYPKENGLGSNRGVG